MEVEKQPGVLVQRLSPAPGRTSVPPAGHSRPASCMTVQALRHVTPPVRAERSFSRVFPVAIKHQAVLRPVFGPVASNAEARIACTGFHAEGRWATTAPPFFTGAS